MTHSKRHIALAIFVQFALIFSVLPVFPAEAATVNEVLRVQESQLVSRGDFIRAVSKVFGKGGKEGIELPYSRVPKGLKPYVAELFEHGDLDHLGKELLHAKPITRGQAITLLNGFVGATGATPESNFTDVRSGSDTALDVSIVVQNGWMEPLRDDFFGVRRGLTGKDAKLLLQRASDDIFGPREVPERLKKRKKQDEAPPPKSPTVKVDVHQPGAKTTLPRQNVMGAIWSLLKQHFLYEDRLDDEEVSHKMIHTMFEELDDPYSVYMEPKDAQSFTSNIKNEHGAGLGVQVRQIDGEIEIVSPLPGSPGEKAGLKPRDRILSVDGQDIVGMNFAEAVNLIKGEKGSEVVLTIRRNGSIMTVRVVRDTIKIAEAVIDWQGDFAMVKIRQFGKSTEHELRAALEEVNESSPEGVVLDLRGNPGGLLSAAKSLLGNFLPKGSVIAHIVTRSGESAERTNQDPVIGDHVPMVVLINGGSASASEITAAALQDHGRATVVGEKSFGKGTVQSFLTTSDGGAFKFTTGRWLSPNKHEIDTVGVTPDVLVSNSGNDDQQMKKALDVLRRK